MQIGNPELDRMCAKAIVPALKACGLDPKRVDKHNKGGLLKSEIIAFIEGSDIIIADLTNERPNCYLEVGYTMGVNKFENLILTVRDDHNQDSPKHTLGGPKIHFDLSGYDILFWDPKDLDKFRKELEKLIKRRQASLGPVIGGTPSPWDREWLSENLLVAERGLVKREEWKGFMEVQFTLSNSKPNKTQDELRKAVEEAQIYASGCPIGVIGIGFSALEKYRPRPKVDRVVCEVDGEEYYGYWALRLNGDFYLLKSLLEDKHGPGSIFFDTRIARVTQALLYCVRLYSQLGVSDTTIVSVGIRHCGFRDRILSAASPMRALCSSPSTVENEVYSEISVPLMRIESSLPGLVKDLTRQLFMVFDFYKFEDVVYTSIINKFIEEIR